jgi:hypothetical protein
MSLDHVKAILDQHSSSVVIKHSSKVTWNQHNKFLLEEMLVVFGK